MEIISFLRLVSEKQGIWLTNTKKYLQKYRNNYSVDPFPSFYYTVCRRIKRDEKLREETRCLKEKQAILTFLAKHSENPQPQQTHLLEEELYGCPQRFLPSTVIYSRTIGSRGSIEKRETMDVEKLARPRQLATKA